MSQVIHFSQAGFEKALETNSLVLVDFWATWCGPCRMIAPAIEKLAAEFDGKVLVGKVDVDQEEELAVQFGVMSIPCVVLLKDGQEIGRLVGAQPYSAYEDLLRQAMQ